MTNHVPSHLMYAAMSEIYKKMINMDVFRAVFDAMHLHTVVNGVDVGHHHVGGEVLGPVSI